MADSNEALKIWDALKPMIDKEIEAKTRSCIRAKKMLVTTAPNGTVIGVAEPYGEEVLIPYSSSLGNAKVDDAVWVWFYFNNASTMIAVTTGEGQFEFPDDPSPVSPVSVEVLLANTYLNSTWTTSGGTITSNPTTDTKTLTFAVSGIPAGSTIDSVVFNATFGSPFTGISVLTANGTSLGTGPQTLALTPTADGNGNYTVTLAFKAYGAGNLSDGSHSSSLSVTSPRVTVVYTPSA